MDKKIKEKLIKHIEFILEPIQGKYKTFENPHFYYSTIREKGSTESIISEKNKITFYHMIVTTKYGEIVMGFCSSALDKDLKGAVRISYGYSELHNKITTEDRKEINLRMMELFRNSKNN